MSDAALSFGGFRRPGVGNIKDQDRQMFPLELDHDSVWIFAVNVAERETGETNAASRNWWAATRGAVLIMAALNSSIAS